MKILQLKMSRCISNTVILCCRNNCRNFYPVAAQWGVRSGAVAPGSHLQGRHFEPLTT